MIFNGIKVFGRCVIEGNKVRSELDEVWKEEQNLQFFNTGSSTDIATGSKGTEGPKSVQYW